MVSLVQFYVNKSFGEIIYLAKVEVNFSTAIVMFAGPFANSTTSSSRNTTRAIAKWGRAELSIVGELSNLKLKLLINGGL